MGRKLTEAALLAEMVKWGGPMRTSTMLGVATAAGVLGVRDRAGFLSMRFGSRASRYRWATEFHELGDHLRSLGYDVDELEAEASAGVAVVAALG